MHTSQHIVLQTTFPLVHDVSRKTVYNRNTHGKGEKHATTQREAVEAHQSGGLRWLSLENEPHGVGASVGHVATAT
jgi:hypothetical protein